VANSNSSFLALAACPHRLQPLPGKPAGARRRADPHHARRCRARSFGRHRDLPQPGVEFPGIHRARPRRHRATHRGGSPGRTIFGRLGRLRHRQHHRPAIRPADRGAAFPHAGLGHVLAGSRLAPHRFNITPSEGFALDRQASDDADIFLLTINPGSIVTFVAEMQSSRLPQIYLWDPGRLQGHGQFLHALPGHRDRHRRPSGAVPDDPLRHQGHGHVSRDGRLRLGGAHLCLDRFRLPQPGHGDISRQRAIVARGHGGGARHKPARVPVRLSQSQPLAHALFLRRAGLGAGCWLPSPGSPPSIRRSRPVRRGFPLPPPRWSAWA
jgi:hypothetical protein